MEIEHNPIEEARKGQEIGLKLSKVRKNDEVYVIRKNIY